MMLHQHKYHIFQWYVAKGMLHLYCYHYVQYFPDPSIFFTARYKRLGKRQVVVVHKQKNKLLMIWFTRTKRTLKITWSTLASLKC
jgi:hypothetical protein